MVLVRTNKLLREVGYEPRQKTRQTKTGWEPNWDFVEYCVTRVEEKVAQA